MHGGALPHAAAASIRQPLLSKLGDRFFFYLPLAGALVLAESWPRLAEGDRRWTLRSGVLGFTVFLLLPLYREVRSFRDFQFGNVQAIGQGLARLPGRGTLLTSEGGYLPFASGWVVEDAWGLNTARFARQLVQPADVTALHPDLIVLHPDLPQDCTPAPDWPARYTDRTWEHMIRNVVRGAQQAGGYQLWKVSYGSEFYRLRKHRGYGEGDAECFLLNRRSPLYGGMAADLRAHHGVPAPGQ